MFRLMLGRSMMIALCEIILFRAHVCSFLSQRHAQSAWMNLPWSVRQLCMSVMACACSRTWSQTVGLGVMLLSHGRVSGLVKHVSF